MEVIEEHKDFSVTVTLSQREVRLLSWALSRAARLPMSNWRTADEVSTLQARIHKLAWS
jgi:hypothetical protein